MWMMVMWFTWIPEGELSMSVVPPEPRKSICSMWTLRCRHRALENMAPGTRETTSGCFPDALDLHEVSRPAGASLRDCSVEES
jgi:hypothetical protein